MPPPHSPTFLTLFQVRPATVSRLLELSHKLGLRDEVAHDAVLLTDRTASQGKQVSGRGGDGGEDDEKIIKSGISV